MLLLKEFGWNWVAVVGSEEEYGQHGVQEFSKIAETQSVCVAYQGLIPIYSDPEPAVKTIIDNIKATNVGVVVVFSLPEPAEVFFKEVSEVENYHNMEQHLQGLHAIGGHVIFNSVPIIQSIYSRLSGGM